MSKPGKMASKVNEPDIVSNHDLSGSAAPGNNGGGNGAGSGGNQTDSLGSRSDNSGKTTVTATSSSSVKPKMELVCVIDQHAPKHLQVR